MITPKNKLIFNSLKNIKDSTNYNYDSQKQKKCAKSKDICATFIITLQRTENLRY